MRPVCVIGASGFVGLHVIKALKSAGVLDLHVLVHKAPVDPNHYASLVHGDILDDTSLDNLLLPGSLVINLASPTGVSGLDAARSLARACARNGVLRLVHMSTAMVIGDRSESTISEETPCTPSDEYGKLKLQVERILKDGAENRFELLILRPTAMFGPRGKNLHTLARRVAFSSMAHRVVRAIAMGHRNMHALDVEAAAKAVVFCLDTPVEGRVQTLLISDDEHPLNNYRGLESCLASSIGVAQVPRWIPELPSFAFQLMLSAVGKPDTRANRVFSSSKLRGMGFAFPRDLGFAVGEYGRWFLRNCRSTG